MVLAEVLAAEPDAEVVVSAERKDGTVVEKALPLGRVLEQPAGTAAPGMHWLPAGRTLALLHAMAYISMLQDGTSPLHVKPDGQPASPPPSYETVRDQVGSVVLLLLQAARCTIWVVQTYMGVCTFGHAYVSEACVAGANVTRQNLLAFFAAQLLHCALLCSNYSQTNSVERATAA